MPLRHMDHARNRYYRLSIAAVIGVLALLLTLGITFYLQKEHISDDQQAIAHRAVDKLDKIFSLANSSQLNDKIVIEQPCSDLQPAMRYDIAHLQTLRTIGIVRNGHISCSSLLGERNLDAAQPIFNGDFTQSTLTLSTSFISSSPAPILLLWKPVTEDRRSGLLYIYNIQLLSDFILSPQRPLVKKIVLIVGDKSLEHGQTEPMPTAKLIGAPLFTTQSAHYNFSVSVYGDSADALSYPELYRHLPLSVLISLLFACAVYFLAGTRMSLTYPISNAISNREFKVYCQPIISSVDGSCIGVETLLRWKNRRQEWISPEVFIPLAEEHNLIIPLTRYLIKHVRDNLALFPSTPQFYISINVAAQHFEKMQIVEDINKLWFNANPQVSLMLELTERTSLQDIEAEQINQLKQSGVQLAIDDFGTGHSSLSYLKTLTPDVLKIDRAFTGAIGTDAINATVTETIITLAQRLKLKLIAEGVETREQAEFLRDKHVQALQGYYFARPMAIEVFPIWLERYQKEAMLTPKEQPSV
ncbi:EAL domain-containing protein [Rouxiella sp. Mn2063]|uniref:EAL domain-containing protein n=1 Tax=Rouxiella sp. Mn2063 TaxID=3395262 RepID=UPI003BD4EC48